MFRSRAAQTTILAAGSTLALITATAGDRAHAEGNLDANYTISFARIPVGEITATAVFGQNEYAISARALVAVTNANRQGIVDPLTALLFSAAAAGEGLSQETCRRTLPI